MARVAVTGAAGFIGGTAVTRRELAEAAQRSWTVTSKAYWSNR